MKETETFPVASREWRIRWRSSNEAFNGGILQVYVYDDAGKIVGIPVNQGGPGADVSYVRSGPGMRYLKINGANIDWHVVVEDQR